MPTAPFVPLRVFSSFTMLEGAIDPKDIPAKARALDYPAVAICDRNGLYGVMPFSEACAKKGVQPIIATLLAVARPDRLGQIDWLALYAQDMAGYENLCALVSASHLDRPVEEDAHVDFDKLEAHSSGLIALTAGAEGALVRLLSGGQQAAAEAYLDRLQGIFGDRLYIEVSRRKNDDEKAAEKDLIALADARALPIVATNPVCYADADFHQAHDTLLCIAGSTYVDSQDRVKSSPEAWMKPARDMAALFADLPDALANTRIVAQRCAVAAPSRKPILPSLAGDREAEAAQLRRDAHAGLDLRLEKAGAVDAQVYRDRLDFELDVIAGMGFPGYFLIVSDFIKWAKAQGIPVGPGRGSGAGSVVAWSLTITDLDPLKLGLLFERFLNPSRVSMPDFDIDFCETRREEVIRYVQKKYGRDHVAQIITFGRLKSRAVLKDTGRVLQMSYGQIDRLAKLVPNHPTDPWDLKRALNGIQELASEYKNDPGVRRLFDLAMKLEGMPRHSSTHAAGVVIGDRPLDQLVPLYRDPRSDMPVTQFDMKYAEAAGLVKFDFLGLKTLSVLHRALDLIEAREGHRPDLDTLGWDDEAVYSLLQRGDTVGVFQMESEGMRRALAQVRPTAFGDIIAIGALYRPGPMDNIPMFADRKNGRAILEYPHPLLEGILAETYGIFVYQEQVMQAGQILAGFSLGDADLLRRAMGKKIKAEMDAQRAGFVEGCGRNGIGRTQANSLFDLIDKFAGYGFNKSHAAAYAVLTYQTAWVKAHYREDFFAASMAFDLGNTDKLAIFADDMRRMGVKCLAPCINRSSSDFTVEATEDGLAVRYALGALKGVGEAAMAQLCVERQDNGAFKSLDDFANRISARLVNRRQIESLSGAGALDALDENRAGVFAVAETLLAVASRAEEGRTSGQGGLFGEGEASVVAVQLPTSAVWSMAERMSAEREAFGFYFSAHPVDRFRHVANSHGARNFTSLASSAGGEGRTSATMAALVEEARWRTSKRGNRFLSATLSDETGQFQANCFDDDAATALEELGRNGGCALLNVELERQPGEEVPRVTVRKAQRLDSLASNARLKAVIGIDRIEPVRALSATLVRGGRSEIILRVALQQGGTADVLIGRDFLIDGEMADGIARMDGIADISLAPYEMPRLALVG
ncbi:MAG: DNA polymerase III subunit alpha [Sphingomonadales bacterium]